MNHHKQAIVTALAILTAASAHALPIDVYIVAGQSNASGAALPGTPPAQYAGQANLYAYKQKNPNVAGFLESAGWETVRSLWPNGYGSTFGPELTFAYELQERTGDRVAIIKTSQGASSLSGNWMPANHDVYDWSIAKVQASLADLTAAGYEPNLAGLLWIQGEADASSVGWGTYAENLATLFDAFRSDLGVDVPVYLNLLHGGSKHVYRDQLRGEQLDFLRSYPNAFGCDPSGLPLGGDLEHYMAAGQLGLGRLFANLVAPRDGDFDGDGDVDLADLPRWRADYDNGISTGDGLLRWQRTAQMTAAVSIPEPSGLLLALAFLTCVPRTRNS